MIDFERYKKWMIAKANQNDYDLAKIEHLIEYAEILNNRNLPIIYDQKHLSLLMGKDYAYLIAVSNSQIANYKVYKLPKRRGGYRTIMEPLPSLLETQRWILENILNPIKDTYVAKNAKAYMPGRSIKDNARLHCNKHCVLNIDLSDFFGSVTFGMVMNFFISLGYARAVSVMLANLCTCHGSLPQGAPTSPMLSNMIFKPLDDMIFSYCRSKKILFSRYADDMTFSGDFNSNHLILFLGDVLKRKGFFINRKKTKIYTRQQRQLVTNVVVNTKPHVRRKTIRELRQEAYYISKFGIIEHLNRINSNFTPDYYLKRILGKINYTLFINPQDSMMIKAKSQVRGEIERFSQSIHKNNHSNNRITYSGVVHEKEFVIKNTGFIKLPIKLNPKNYNITGKIPSKRNEYPVDIWQIENWDTNLSNYDLN